MKGSFFCLLVFSQLISLLYVRADKNKKDSLEFNSIKWEKIKENKSNKLKKGIWKSHNDDESYFLDIDKKTYSKEDIKNFIKDEIYKSQRKQESTTTEVEPYLPLNNFLDYGNFQYSVRWKSSFDGGVSQGIGQQNPSFVFDYGISDSSLITLYVTGADDDLYNLIDGKRINYYWQNYGLSYKKKLLDEKDFNFGLSIVSTLEYWRHASGSETSKSIFNQKDNSFGKDKFESIIGALSLPISKNVNKNTTFFIVPGITFLPQKLGDKGIGKNAYGNNFYLGSGLALGITEDVNLHLSYTTPLGPGDNYFDSNLKYSRKPIYSYGLGWNVNPQIEIEGKITNSYGARPSTGLLTIPSDNLPLYSANIIYRPYAEDTFLQTLNKKDQLINHRGITVSNALIPQAGTSQFNFNIDSKGNFFGFYGYSLSNIFQLEMLNIGSFKSINHSGSKNSSLYKTYLNENNVNFRLGGKLLIFSPQKDDLMWMSIRTTVGRNDDTNQGYLFSELINTYRFNNWLAFNVSPKYFASGIDNFGGVGVSSYINLTDNLQLIPEINTSFRTKSIANATLALRYSYSPGASVDFYCSNALGIQDIGQLLEGKGNRFGINFNILH